MGKTPFAKVAAGSIVLGAAAGHRHGFFRSKIEEPCQLDRPGYFDPPFLSTVASSIRYDRFFLSIKSSLRINHHTQSVFFLLLDILILIAKLQHFIQNSKNDFWCKKVSLDFFYIVLLHKNMYLMNCHKYDGRFRIMSEFPCDEDFKWDLIFLHVYRRIITDLFYCGR